VAYGNGCRFNLNARVSADTPSDGTGQALRQSNREGAAMAKGRFSISTQELYRRIGTAAAPLVRAQNALSAVGDDGL
jgi:hypothetical protein